MNDIFSDLVEPSLMDQVDAALDEFTNRWRTFARAADESANPPAIRQHLTATHEFERSALLYYLIQVDVEMREKLDVGRAVGKYYRDFPGHRAVVDAALHDIDATDDVSPSTVDVLRPVAEPAGPDAPPEGCFRFHKYDLEEEPIGCGGMGIVYRGRDITLGRLIALKMIRLRQPPADVVRRFRDEASAASQIKHPNVVGIYEIGQFGGENYLTMEYLVGGTLEDLRRTGPIDVARAVEWMRDVADAVESFHEQKIRHRDLKPANIILSDERPVVVDFGLAKLLEVDDDRTGDGILGTPSYMPPEQIDRPATADHRADVYSLGATLYALITGRPPFTAATRIEITRQVVNAEPLAPRSLNPAVSRDVETICLKCLQKDPGRRYQSARELADELQRVLRGEPIQARPITTTERTWRWVRRNRWQSALIAAVATILMLVGVGSTAFAVRETHRRQVETGLRQQAEGLAKREQQARQRVEALLARRATTRGIRQLESGDNLAAMASFVDALEVDQHDENRAAMHRVRLAAVARRTPTLKQMWFHDRLVSNVAFSPDGRRLLSTSWDGTAQLWDVESGAAATPPLKHDDYVLHGAFSRDGKYVVTGGSDRTARVWRATDGELLTRMPAGGPVLHTRFGPQSERVVLAAGQRNAGVRMMKIFTGMKTLYLPDSRGRLVKTQVPAKPINVPLPIRGAARVWHFAKALEQPEAPLVEQRFSYAGWVNHVALSEDGKRALICTGRILGKAQVEVRALDGEEKWKIPVDGTDVSHGAFSPDGRRVALAIGSTSGPGYAVVWDLDKNQMVGRRLIHQAKVVRARFSPDGKRILTASWDGTARLWEAETGYPIGKSLNHANRVRDADFGNRGRWVVTAADDETGRLWDSETGRPLSPLLKHKGPVSTVAVHPTRPLVASGGPDGVVRLWHLEDLESGVRRQAQFVQSKTAYKVAAPAAGRLAVLEGSSISWFDSDGRGLGRQGVQVDKLSLHLYDLPARKPVPVPLDNDALEKVTSVTLAGSFALLRAPAADGGPPRVWIVDIRKPTRVGDAWEFPGLQQVALSPDGSRLAVATKDGLALWDVAARTVIAGQLTKTAARLQFSDDSQLLAVATSVRDVEVFNGGTGEQVAGPLKHARRISRMSVGDGGRLLAVAVDSGRFQEQQGGEVFVWEIPVGKPAAPPIELDWAVTQLAFAPHGARLATAGADGTTRIWDARRGEAVTAALHHRLAVTHLEFHRDSRLLLTASDDGTARVWDAMTGEPITPPLVHAAAVNHATFSATGDAVVTASSDRSVGFWPLPTETRSVDELRRRVELLSGRHLDETATLIPLDREQLKERWEAHRAAPAN